MNASWNPEFIREYQNVDISVAVQTPKGLLTPIVKDADNKRMLSISSDVKELAKKVGRFGLFAGGLLNLVGVVSNPKA